MKGNKFAAGTGSKLVCTGYYSSEEGWWHCKNMKDHKSSVVSARLDSSGLFMISGSIDLQVIISSAFIEGIDDEILEFSAPFNKVFKKIY